MVVVRDVLPQHQSPVTLVHDDQMVETFAPERSHDALRSVTVAHAPAVRSMRKRRSRFEFATTDSELRAIAAAAIIGLSSRPIAG